MSWILNTVCFILTAQAFILFKAIMCQATVTFVKAGAKNIAKNIATLGFVQYKGLTSALVGQKSPEPGILSRKEIHKFPLNINFVYS